MNIYKVNIEIYTVDRIWNQCTVNVEALDALDALDAATSGDLAKVGTTGVTKTVDNFIWECIQNGITQATIVTGNSEPMKQIVITCLNEHGLQAHPFFNIGGSITFDL